MHEGPDDLFQNIDQLLEAGSFEAAQAALEQAPTDDAFQMLRVKLGLLSGTLVPDAAMQRLIQLMRRTPDLPGAKALYQEASKRAYSSRESSIAHSHPPPPDATNTPKR